MKKWLLLFLLFAALLLSTGCGAEPDPEDMTTTVMIYMIGSDLEARTGAGTNDLLEMEDSGVDTEKVNLLVCTGGTPYWHNQTSNPEELSILLLTENGFGKASAVPAKSMGDPESLTAFLNFGTGYFPADRYALILWDHGNGPVIGYGKDLLFDNDALTLAEMDQALSATAFAGEQKLDWVGFDACLMASAELACVWADYANYLIASQEVEPSFGWDYRFLNQIGTTDTEMLIRGITGSYLNACQDYYDRRGYEDRDTTLSGVDLRKADQLQEAVNSLFSAAGADVERHYGTLTGRRVETRALGRASTGSEYDLIDLYDLSAKLADLYPAETATLQQVLTDMTVANATNAEDCCGMSLYYPFYNKSYYEKEWGAAYSELGVFQDYLTYLKRYQEKWLGTDLLDTAAVSREPETAQPGTYTLQLTPEQSASFAQARYSVLKQEGYGLYKPVFTSPEVIRQEDVLTASFQGEVLYAANDNGFRFIPAATAYGTIGGSQRYSVYVQLNNYRSSYLPYPEGYELRTEEYRFDLAVDPVTDQVTVSGLLPYSQADQENTLLTGKAEEVDLSQWTTYYFPDSRQRYLTRYGNGVVKPLKDWERAEILSGVETPVGDGLEFIYEPLAAGEYYLIFEITDTQGNGYCSELLPITVAESQLDAQPVENREVHWTQGDQVVLFQEQGITLSLCQTDRFGEPGYTLELQNDNAYPVVLKSDGLLCNGNIFCPDGYTGTFAVQAGETVRGTTAMQFGAAEDLDRIGTLKSLSFDFRVENGENRSTVVGKTHVTVGLSQETGIDLTPFRGKIVDGPCLGGYGEEQVLYEEEALQVTLLSFGAEPLSGAPSAWLSVENRGDTPLLFRPEGLAVNDTYLHVTTPAQWVPAGCRYDCHVFLTAEDFILTGITGIREMELCFSLPRRQQLSGSGGFGRLVRCPVKLTSSSQSADFEEGQQVLFAENGIRVAWLATQTEENGQQTAYLSVVNHSDEDIQLSIGEALLVGQKAVAGQDYSWLYVEDGQVCAGQQCVAKVSFQGKQNVLEDYILHFRILDFQGDRLLYTVAEPDSLPAS